ncbi:MAG: YdeI/OmpD-associated family protein [Sphingomicrobium sp.]
MEAASADFRHQTPASLKAVLARNPAFAAKWTDLTELARNEWICWMISPKKQDTRDHHLERLLAEVGAGKRRPCCWPGCPHRRALAGRFRGG